LLAAACVSQAAGLAACAPHPGPATYAPPRLALMGTAPDYYPVDVGRRWVYRTFQTQGDSPEHPGKDQRFEAAFEAGGGTVLRRWYDDWEAPPTLVRKHADSVVLSRHVAGGPAATDSITILRLPLKAGNEWPGRTLVGATEVIAALGTESIEVPAGRFVAWHLRHQLSYSAGGSDALDYWYSGGVGMVQAIERITLQTSAGPLPMQVRALLAER